MKRFFSVLLACSAMAHGEWVDLWPGKAPGAKRPAEGTEKTGDGGRMTGIEVPQYEVHLPDKEKATGAAVVILPGGGYTILAMQHEGREYAKWLTDRGVAAVVVKYRVSGDDAHGYQFPVPFLDARRAIRTARAKAEEWGIHPGKIGVMGSSAGGHLASLCATRFEDDFDEETGDEIDAQSCRPSFAILIYPVISMSKPLAHEGSRRRLLGASPSRRLVEKCSTDLAITANTPPVFLLHTSDDGVDCRNSLAFATACKANGVPVTLHLFETGGHGYGLNGDGTVGGWPVLLEAWLKNRVGEK